MAGSAVPAIPAPLTGVSFLKASHVQLGAERQAQGSARQSFSHAQFPPFWGFHRAAPAPPPRSRQVLGLAGGDGGETGSETRLAFPERSLQPAAPFVPPESRVRMHTDPPIAVLASETRESFPCPRTMPRQEPPLPSARRRGDDIPRGDREKIRLPPSTYTTSYPAHEVQPAAGPWRRGCVPTIKGEGRSYYHTSYQAQFQGEWGPPAKPSEKHVSSVKFGYPRSSGSTSEQKHTYSAPDKRTPRVYDKEHAASQIHRTNLQLGDGCSRFSTSTSELFPAHDPEPVITARPNKYASFIPRGDEDPERNQALARTTTTQLSYPEPDRWNLPLKPDLLLQKHRSNVCLGAERPGSHFFSTTQQADYQPPRQSQRVMTDSKSHRESHIPFNYHTDEGSVTTMRATLVPHSQQKQRLSEDVLQQIKCSHLGLPCRTQDLFRTEQKEFTPKTRGPAEIQKATSRVSCVPLGTLKRYCPQRKVLFAA